ncbi:MAG: VOC family protein [Melioribacteraceae bacterium]|nr:VOC family protein [Melioribacteraceae bacterium]MCF8263624.1 VOC family protein [Melioribacteraceae bacterium]MCF8412069.1 VOC family protein [Melioribacteraceae bacterium]MCF8431339.1 VOC family protein [Melioribacteraceae bacterium]
MIDIKRTGHTAIEVNSVVQATKFYKDNFGFEVVYVADDWGIVRKNGDDLAFIKKGVSHHPPHFGLRVATTEEVDSAYEELKTKVKILKEPIGHRDGSYSFYFADLDKNVVELIFDPNVA